MSSPLNSALVQRDLQETERLLSEGADPNAPNEKGLRPLHVAISAEDPAGSLELVKSLIKHGAPVDEWDLEHYETPLLRACDPRTLPSLKCFSTTGRTPMTAEATANPRSAFVRWHRIWNLPNCC